MKIIEQDAGLWQVWDKHGRGLGFIFDGGWKVSGCRRRKGALYHALRQWDNGPWEKQGRLGSHRSFSVALSYLFKNQRKEQARERRIDKLAVELLKELTLAQHTGFAWGDNPQFRNAVEEHMLTDVRDIASVEKAGGLLFDHYPIKEQDATNYPPEVKGLIPRVRGTFSKKKVGGLRIYIPPTT